VVAEYKSWDEALLALVRSENSHSSSFSQLAEQNKRWYAMEETSLVPITPYERTGLTVRDVVMIGFRRRRLVGYSFAAFLLLALIAGLLLNKYQSEMQILVNAERVDPLVTPGDKTLLVARPITPEELNSEIALITSEDVLRSVVEKERLYEDYGWSVAAFLAGAKSKDWRIESASRELRKKLDVEPGKKSNTIQVTYVATDPDRAARVMSTLSKAYLQKHLAAHKPPGQYTFFQQEADHYRNALQEQESRLSKFSSDGGAVVAQTQRDITLQKLGDLQVNLVQTQSAIEETRKRITILKSELASAQPRIMTQLRSSQNPQLLQQLEGTLLNLQLKRTELLQKFAPSYRLVQEVDEQIRTTQHAIEQARSTPLRDETTDRDATYEWMRGDLAKATADLQSLEGRQAVTLAEIARFRDDAQHFNDAGIEQHRIMRDAQALEEAYLLYVRKREEARITDAMDERKILNVAFAEEPTRPVLPKYSFLLVVAGAVALASIGSLTATGVCEYFDPSFHRPDDVRRFLSIPAVASLPDVRS
jgi:uncharacterized protein involved in exopolysaccharide biosynthesis